MNDTDDTVPSARHPACLPTTSGWHKRMTSPRFASRPDETISETSEGDDDDGGKRTPRGGR